MDDGEGKAPPRGRFERFRKLATLSAQLGTDVVARGVKRLAGQEPDLLGKGAAEKLVATLGDLKGMAMKLGQAASMNADLFPKEVLAVLSRLQNEAPSMPYAAVAEVVEADLGAPVSSLFAEFSERPLAAASLGQVHRARMEDGREVAVKVQYPGIAEALQADLDNLGSFVKALSFTSKSMDARAYFQELSRELTLELDYQREARLAAEMAEALAGEADLYVPRVVAERTSPTVLTLELLPGRTLKELLAADAPNDERLRVSLQLIRALHVPFLDRGIVHADPHPGNFIVMTDGRLGLLDFGAVKRFSEPFRAGLSAAFREAVEQRPQALVPVMRTLGFSVDLPDDEAEALTHELVHIAGRPLRASEYDYASDTVVQDTRKLVTQNVTRFLKMRPPPEGILCARAFGGLSQNLRMLGARGDFRPVYAALAARAPRAVPTSTP